MSRSVEEYLRLSEKPTCEYRDGVLYPKAMPAKFHSELEFMLVLMLRKLGLEAVPEVAVLLCCEILSPEDRLGTMLATCEEYHAWGVPYCWVIDPVMRTAWEYHAGAGEYAAAWMSCSRRLRRNDSRLAQNPAACRIQA